MKIILEPTTEVDYQCKRCGSSIFVEACERCDGSGTVGHECGEDCCSCADPIDNVPCDICDGVGSWAMCLSTAEWCQAHPRPGQEATERNTVEEFTIGGFSLSVH